MIMSIEYETQISIKNIILTVVQDAVFWQAL